MLDYAKEASDLKHALAENAYPAADGSADIDNHALPVIEVTLREVGRRATEHALRRIREIIENVDQRALAADGPVTPTLKEMTQDEMSAIYALACGKFEGWRP